MIMADDWDLYAIVRNCSNPATTIKESAIKVADEAFSFFKPGEGEEEEDRQFYFPNLSEKTSNGFEELHQIHKSFLSNHIAIDKLQVLNPSLNLQQKKEEEEVEDEQKLQIQKEFLPATSQLQNPRTRKRKIQQERIVCQVTAENLSSDMWSWRKYGQKPIKGSPHPRNYYRCSSSKGCSARKQVERSISDPNIYTISYTGDHAHSRPLHRNSLAGSTRNRIQATEKTTVVASSPSGLSPTTPFAVQNEEEAIKETYNDEEKEADEISISEDDGDILIPNMMAMKQDFFLLQDFGFAGVGRTPAKS